MKPIDLAIGFVLAAVLHVGVCFVPGLSTDAQVAFQSGESALALTLMPSPASVAMRRAPEPEKPIDPSELIEKDIPRPKKQVKEKVPEPQKPKKITSEFEIVQIVNRIPPIRVQKIEVVDDIDPSVSNVANPTATVEEVEPDPPPEPERAKEPEVKEAPKPVPHDSVDSKETVGDVRSKGVDVKATYTNLQKPKYPRCCRRRQREGVVLLAVTITASGECGGIQVLQSGGCPRMDEAAVEAVRKAHFTPARALGMPVTSTKKLKFRFRLTDE